MKKELIHKYALEKLQLCLPLWENGGIPDSEERELQELARNLQADDGLLESVIESMPPDTRECLETFLALENLKLTDTESARLDSVIATQASEERRPRRMITSVKKWMARLSVGISAACLVLLLGMAIFFDDEFHLGRHESKIISLSGKDSLRNQQQDMIAMESVSSPEILKPRTASGGAEHQKGEPKTINVRRIKSKKAQTETTEDELEKCRRLMKEMNLNSGIVSSGALIMLNADFKGDISSKVIVTEIFRDMSPREALKM